MKSIVLTCLFVLAGCMGKSFAGDVVIEVARGAVQGLASEETEAAK